ncbi:serine/threonine-protein phosphatase 7 long form homolog [Primulina huaijiensis]|uniref:serine/threonine-protein phosphatase 7 long form homolog n=1 Tax=Primulina huaijiensis TaxID=1492673 RepID=UPI003CC77426
MGFYSILCCGDFVYGNHLITALVERWCRETHTFHLRVGETTITLQDVAIIWGLNVDGDPIIGTDVCRKFIVWQGYCYDWLGFVPLQTDFRSNSLKLTTLYLHCTQTIIGENSTDIEVAQYSRCVALMVIGGCMLPDSEVIVGQALYLHICIMSCVMHLDQGNKKSQDLYTFYRWSNLFTWTHTPTHSVQIIRDVLDKMGDDQFKWLVYDIEVVDVLSLPLECKHPTLWRSVCPLICFHIVEMHRPNRVLRQFGMSQNIPIPALTEISYMNAQGGIAKIMIG